MPRRVKGGLPFPFLPADEEENGPEGNAIRYLPDPSEIAEACRELQEKRLRNPEPFLTRDLRPVSFAVRVPIRKRGI